MDKKHFQPLLLSLALLGLVASARADDPVLAKPVPVSGTMGLLGQAYAGLTYTCFDRHDSPVNADGLSFQLNQPLNAGLDGNLTYDWNQTGFVAGSRLNRQTLGGALRAFSTALPWGRPYVEAGLGYAWTRSTGPHDNSLVWKLATGVEFQVTPALAVTPYIRYQDAHELAGGSMWNFGVTGNYWVNSQWAVTAGLNYDDRHNSGFTVGTNFRF